jgi:hypothetical protein
MEAALRDALLELAGPKAARSADFQVCTQACHAPGAAGTRHALLGGFAHLQFKVHGVSGLWQAAHITNRVRDKPVPAKKRIQGSLQACMQWRSGSHTWRRCPLASPCLC